MASGDESSELSSLSALSSIASDDEVELPEEVEPAKAKTGILNYFSKVSEQPPKEPTPPPRKRSPSPPHEYVLADNPDIAFIVMFRSRFSEAFPKSLAHFGPQELERDVVQTVPGDRAEQFLCGLLGLLLNRKQDVKPGHYGRALEDAIASHKNQWARSWEDKSPLSGGKSFNTMDPTERLTLLRTLILWTLSSSDTVKGLINQSYKGNRHEEDLTQPRSVQPWGTDGDKRRYFLIEGQDDTAFRVYRESNPAGTQRTWWSVAGSIEELKDLANKLETKDGGPKAKKFASRITMGLGRFEAGEDKRKRRDYRQMRKEQFKRPEPGFSMYEGRTRGKRIKYTYSDDEDVSFSDSTTRRSARNTGTTTPAESGPVTTSSGRQIRAPSRLNVATGDSAPNSVEEASPGLEQDDGAGGGGRAKRSAAVNHGTNGWSAPGRRANQGDSDEEESEAEFGDDEEDVDEHVPEESEDEDDYDDEEAMVDDDLGDEPRSLVVKLSVTPPKLRTALSPTEQTANILPISVALESKPTVPETPVVEMQDVQPSDSARETSTGVGVPAAPDTETKRLERATTPNQTASRIEPLHDTASMSTTPLAFRGSPEKHHEHTMASTINVGNER